LDQGWYEKEGGTRCQQRNVTPSDWLSDLARLPGVKGIRARLYYDAGVDCVEKMAACETEALLALTAEFVERTGFNGIAPLPKEVASTIANAKRLPRVVEY
jgi:hypothetical protein